MRLAVLVWQEAWASLPAAPLSGHRTPDDCITVAAGLKNDSTYAMPLVIAASLSWTYIHLRSQDVHPRIAALAAPSTPVQWLMGGNSIQVLNKKQRASADPAECTWTVLEPLLVAASDDQASHSCQWSRRPSPQAGGPEGPTQSP